MIGFLLKNTIHIKKKILTGITKSEILIKNWLVLNIISGNHLYIFLEYYLSNQSWAIYTK